MPLPTRLWEGTITDAALQRRRALVCGSTRGIGRAAAFELARLGARVTLLARSKAALARTCEALPPSAHHDYLVADFTDLDAVGAAARANIAAEGPVHVLVNNTAGPPGGPITDAEPEEFLAAFSSHLLCNQQLARVVLPGMKAEKYGRIINIVSTSVKEPIPGLGVSNTVRGAVASWAKTLAGEVARFGITVNNVLPGATRTDRLRAIIASKAQRSGRSVEEVERDMQAEIPTGRFAEPDEIAAAIGFLASPAAGYITGVSLAVDGGRTGCL